MHETMCVQTPWSGTTCEAKEELGAGPDAPPTGEGGEEPDPDPDASPSGSDDGKERGGDAGWVSVRERGT